MNLFDVTYQLVQSPVDKSERGRSVDDDGLIDAFRAFPFANDIARATENATFPTIAFKRQSDGEEIAIWTTNAEKFDVCLVKGRKKSFLHNRSRAQVEGILARFKTESVDAIHPAGIFDRWLNRTERSATASSSTEPPQHDVPDRHRLVNSPDMVVSPLRVLGAIAAVIVIFATLFVLALRFPHPVGAFLLAGFGIVGARFIIRSLSRGWLTVRSGRYSRAESPLAYWFWLGSFILFWGFSLAMTGSALVSGWAR